MSTASSIVNSLRHTPTTLATEHHISLLDEEDDERQHDAERNDSEAPDPAPSAASPIQRVLKRNPSSIQQSLKRQWTKQKYARYDRDRYNIDNDPAPDDPSAPPTQVGDDATHTQTNYLERGRAKAKTLLKRKGTLGQRKNELDTVIDILYENQRGVFFFGVPKYSSSSLLPSDPNAWLNGQLRASPVDIRNAQVPDPSWEWAWKSWYVDMSRDVDEEGWEYSFQFSGRFAWHGNHPWFHSFVRRRRWLRMRRRRDPHHHTREKAHEFTPEYFTIHPKTVRTATETYNHDGSSDMARRFQEQMEDEEDPEKMEITDIASLISIMKRAAVDREKLFAVRKFVDTGGEELYYLSDRMPEIMNIFIFQSSRRQLLAELLLRFDAAHERRESLKDHQHDDDAARKDHDIAAKRAENLINAVKAAEEQVKKLEYWSDIKDLAHEGQTVQHHNGANWDDGKWQGLTGHTAFASKQSADEGTPELHRHPEHNDEDEDDASAVTAPSKKSGSSVVAVKHPGRKNSSDGYVTAAESASEIPDKPDIRSKSRPHISSLDGVAESDGDGKGEEPLKATPVTTTPSNPATPSRRAAKLNVSIVEPVPEPIDDRSPGGAGGGGDGS